MIFLLSFDSLRSLRMLRVEVLSEAEALPELRHNYITIDALVKTLLRAAGKKFLQKGPVFGIIPIILS